MGDYVHPGGDIKKVAALIPMAVLFGVLLKWRSGCPPKMIFKTLI
ncbi:hypothetical protein DFR46_2536 [Parasphingopyxis lamellibrachiae]|uniref:Uncharacterized protein n=1 Tax=Parasphingopyxis lamellibrachiae TaxID=680125 RepID=A0A3D9FI63_9SPHN|nr:hypothetical protein DFR46_2536 [Parasphingopyxis lamellibrachiae]